MKLTSPLSKANGFIFVVTALLLFTSSTSLAQTQEPAKPTSEVEQLKQRLQQLEQTKLNDNWSKTSDDFRIQFSFKYNFSKTFTY